MIAAGATAREVEAQYEVRLAALARERAEVQGPRRAGRARAEEFRKLYELVLLELERLKRQRREVILDRVRTHCVQDASQLSRPISVLDPRRASWNAQVNSGYYVRNVNEPLEMGRSETTGRGSRPDRPRAIP